jgi:hypothetical protein
MHPRSQLSTAMDPGPATTMDPRSQLSTAIDPGPATTMDKPCIGGTDLLLTVMTTTKKLKY